MQSVFAAIWKRAIVTFARAGLFQGQDDAERVVHAQKVTCHRMQRSVHATQRNAVQTLPSLTSLDWC